MIILNLHYATKIASDLSYKIGKFVLITTMFAIFCGVVIQVFFRYILNQPLMFLSEFTAWTLVWAGYFGASVALKTNEHISLTLFINFFNNKILISLKLIAKLLLFLFIICLIIYGFKQSFGNVAFSWAVGLRVMWANLGIPISAILMFFHLLYYIIDDIVSILKLNED